MMSTDQDHLSTRTSPTTPRAEPAPEKSGSLDLSVPKIVGGALAAMTTAALGSRLGVGGTLVGAAIASVVAAVATSLYTASLKHTGQRLRSAIPAGRARSGSEADSPESAQVATPAPGLSGPPAASPPRPRRLNWAGIVVGAVAVFALAAAAVTGIELVSGRTFSGDPGTTLGQVSDPAPASAEPTTEPTADPTVTASESSEPEPSEPAAPAPETTAPPESRPSPTAAEPEPSASAEPSTPTESTTPQPSASAPSAEPSAAPSASAGD